MTADRDKTINLKGKFLCVGMGETNLAAAGAILANGGEVVGIDDSPSDALKETLDEMGVEFHPSPRQDEIKKLISSFDYCIPTPGLSDSHYIYKTKTGRTKKGKKKGKKKGAEIISELDYAGFLARNLRIVAITGTTGKSTVVEMLAHCLNESGLKAFAVGNNELPFSTAVVTQTDCDVFVVEASSFQLRNSRYFAPDIAVWLNFAPNHLDMHSSLKAYEKAKAQIWARHEAGKNCWIANSADPVVWKNRPKKGSGQGFEGRGARKENEAAVKAVSKALGISAEDIHPHIQSFKGLEHRMELAAEKNGIKWINDSKATTPHATAAGLLGLGPTVLIAGGRDKSGEFAELKKIANIKAVVAIGESAPRLLEIFNGRCPVVCGKSMFESVYLAAGCAEAGDTVFFSPGGSSFDWYDSYIERGTDFKNKVREFLEA